MTASPEGDASAAFRPIPFAVGAILGALAWLVSGPLPAPARAAAAVTVAVTSWWMGGAMPIGAASLFPFAALPLLGVAPVRAVAAAYFDPIIFLFLGGFLLALGIERWGLHRRLAFAVILAVGTGPRRLVFGLMAATAAISLWISNTATALLMLPIALAVVRGLEESGAPPDRNFAFAALLGVGYAASIGGMGTPVGTAPNLIFKRQFEIFFPDAPPISFLRWMEIGVPVVALLVVLAWAILVTLSRPARVDPRIGEVVRARASALGPWTAPEKRMGTVFVLTALAWMSRQPIEFGAWKLPGWSELFEDPRSVDDSVVAVGAAFLAFVLPAGKGTRERLLDWDTVKRVPWEILFLLGGGFALASAFETSGLSRALGDALVPWVRGAPAPLLVAAVCLLVTALSEVASNTATTQIMLPVLRGVAFAAGIDPRLLLVPATLAASCGFMLPIATPPNAIVFASGRIPVRRMARVGLLVDLAGILAIVVALFALGGPVLGIRFDGAPAWAAPPATAPR